MKCLLCNNENQIFSTDYLKCNHCALIQKKIKNFLNSEEEFGRYQFHQNEVHDEGYVNFLKKLIDPLDTVTSNSWTHLDFGSGKKSWYQIYFQNLGISSYVYDLYFYPDKSIVKKQYDLVTCSEVVEHFQNPRDSFDLLINTVKPGGYLAIMTSFYSEEIDFQKWWYKNDPTHVVFYTERTLEYLAELYQLEIFYNDHKSVVIFKRG